MLKALPVHETLLHPLTGQPLRAIGIRPDGSPLWPIMGASEDSEDANGDEPDDEPGEENDAQDAPDDADDTGGDGSEVGDDGADALGDAGKQALDRMKAKLKEERARRREAEGKLAEKDGDDGATHEAIVRANARIVKSEVKAAAKGVLADPADAYKFLDLDQFEVDDDGNVDEDDIADAIADLVKKKPYLAAQGGRRFQGDASSGTRKEARPKQLTRADLKGLSPAEIDRAHKAGQLNDLLKNN